MPHGRTFEGRRAFTFLEMTVAVLVLGLAAAALLPGGVRLRHRQRRRAAAGRIRGALASAQVRALMGGRRVEFVCSRTWCRRMEEGASVIRLPPDMEIAGAPRIVCAPDGTMTPARLRVCDPEGCEVLVTGLRRGEVVMMEENR